MDKHEQQEQTAEAKQTLMAMVKPGDTVYTILRQVSRSGMSRHISVQTIQDDKPYDITYLVARVLNMRRNDHDGGLIISGCGMDMGFEIVYLLSYALFPKGFKVEGRGRNGDASGWDNDGGYAMKQSWL